MQLKAKTNVVDLAAFAFYQGAHGVPIDETHREIDSTHDKERAKAEEESVRRQKPIEAQVETLEHRRGIVDAAWNDVLRRSGHHEPPVATAFLVSLLGLSALAVDAVLLGPGLDALGISDPAVQLASAFGLAALSSLAFHLAHESFERNHLNLETRFGWRILGGVTVFALLAWGVLRGYQVQFAAHQNDNPLGDFLGAHTVLASIFFSFVTLAAPLVGAAAIHYAVPRVYEWRNWHKAKREHEALYHELAGLVAGCVLGAYLAPLYFALPVGAWTTAFLYYRHRRIHPTYDQFKRQENTRFAVTDDLPPARELRTPQPHLLSKGDQS